MASNKPDALLVMPVTGKYCEIVADNRIYKIWKVHPNSPTSYGTLIPYDVAVYFLGRVPPVITLVPQTKNGKYVSAVLPEDQKKIQDSLARGFVGTYENFKSSLSEGNISAGDPEALKKTVGLLEAQVTKNKELESQMSSLLARLEQLEKSQAKAS